MSGRVVDLYRLYTSVSALGGWRRIGARWPQVYDECDVDVDTMCGAEYALKLVYMQYLSRYEQYTMTGSDVDTADVADDRRGVRQVTAPVEFLHECPVRRPRPVIHRKFLSELGINKF